MSTAESAHPVPVPRITAAPSSDAVGEAVPDRLGNPPFIPLLDVRAGTRLLRGELDRAWRTVLAHGRFTDGPEVETFESQFADYCGTSACVGVGSGSDALELSLAALGIGPGDEVVLPGNAFVGTAEAVCAVGAFPRFVDVLPTTLQIDPDAVAGAVNRRTAAVIAVHMYGQMADVDRLEAVAQRHGLVLLEDATQAPGATFGSRRAGSVGLAAAFSFAPGTNLGGLGDGGALVSDDSWLLARVRQLADHGRSPDDRHEHGLRGRRSRLDTLQAAVLGVKLAHLDDDNRARRILVQRYRERLPLDCPLVGQHPQAQSVHHHVVVQVKEREAATRALSRDGIGWALHYPVPCHRQPAFAEFADDVLPVAERAAERVLSLPLSPTMSYAQVDRVSEVLSRERRRRRR
ncbi:DegT/DnrJ/EryC1/StrS family aminotransferase [Blastococcus sp. SYSU D00669]